jgi:glc operon protein GlcG
MSLGMGQRLERVWSIAERVADYAQRYSFDMALVAVDEGGRVILTYRTDLCSWTAIEPARKKAIASATMRLATSSVAAITMLDQLALRALSATPDILAVPGGFPLIIDGNCVGGIGVAGGHYGDDQYILSKALVEKGDMVPAMPTGMPNPQDLVTPHMDPPSDLVDSAIEPELADAGATS